MYALLINFPKKQDTENVVQKLYNAFRNSVTVPVHHILYALLEITD